MLWCPVKLEPLCVFAGGSSLPMLQRTYDVQCVLTALAHTWTGKGLQTEHTPNCVIGFDFIRFVILFFILQHTLKRSEEIVIQSHTNESTCGLHTTFFHICILNAITEEHSSQVGVGQKLMGCQQISGHINSHTRAEENEPGSHEECYQSETSCCPSKASLLFQAGFGFKHIRSNPVEDKAGTLFAPSVMWSRCISRVGPPPLDPIGSVTNQCLPHFIIERSCQNLVCLHDRARKAFFLIFLLSLLLLFSPELNKKHALTSGNVRLWHI